MVDVHKLQQAVVLVEMYRYSTDPDWRRQSDFVGGGTGWVYARNGNTYTVVTNAHLVAKDVSTNNRFMQVHVRNLSTGSYLPTQILGSDPFTGTAVLQVESTERLEVLPLAQIPSKVGDQVWACGNPGNNFATFQSTRVVTSGIHTKTSNLGLTTTMYTTGIPILWTDTVMFAGNSGSPIVNANTEVVAMLQIGIVFEVDGHEDMTYGTGNWNGCIPVDALVGTVETLRQTPNPPAQIGANTVLAAFTTQNMPNHEVTVIDTPQSGSMFQMWDVVTAIGDDPIRDEHEVYQHIQMANIGDTLSFHVRRLNQETYKEKTLKVRVQDAALFFGVPRHQVIPRTTARIVQGTRIELDYTRNRPAREKAGFVLYDTSKKGLEKGEQETFGWVVRGGRAEQVGHLDGLPAGTLVFNSQGQAMGVVNRERYVPIQEILG